MKKERLITKIENSWMAFMESFAGLTDDMLMEPGVVGYWSVRDVLAHISTWEEEAIKVFILILDGKPVPLYRRYGGIDAFNAREQERKRYLTLEQVKDELAATHQRLLQMLKETDESVYSIDKRLAKRFRYDTFGHYLEHADQIKKWRSVK
jgi:hypothetical protein